MPDQPAGPILDGLGITLDLEDRDLVVSALVLAKVVKADGQVVLVIEDSEGMSWLDQLGLVSAADAVIRTGGYQHDDED
ncbi:hypothetical protein [Actinoplanes siamensis]|uniref:Uncharacterized protein n=1 Tax=Actinoplanes siamensis TaxID=1223317 RepID=A0A919NCH5_9ACTN|nr:hypothetical protein [Actinoplanes siamensis]GIF08674.1 hypothetical protein Asi03nite_62120 [Actinoplanes siamensis]